MCFQSIELGFVQVLHFCFDLMVLQVSPMLRNSTMLRALCKNRIEKWDVGFRISETDHSCIMDTNKLG